MTPSPHPETPFAVAIATKDRPELLERALVSACRLDAVAQVIVVDDGSTAANAARVSSMCDGRAEYVRTPGLGLSGARNVGLAAARHEWILFLDDDDHLVEGMDRALGPFLADPTCVVVSGAVVFEDEAGTPAAAANVPRPHGAAFFDNTLSVMAGSWLARTNALRTIGGYLLDLECSHQTELWLRLSRYANAVSLVCASTEGPFVRIRQVAPDRRSLRSPAQLYRGTEKILALHRPQLERSPGMPARYLAIAGVAAARSGDRAAAVRLLGQACLAEPAKLRNWMQFARYGFGTRATASTLRRNRGRHRFSA